MNRTESMVNHLISQFRGKPVISAIIEAIGDELDELDTVFAALRRDRWIDTGVGAQLDGIGDIVARDRTIKKSIPLNYFGFYDQTGMLSFGMGRFREQGESYLSSRRLKDAEYRPVLWAKVFKNTSHATAEETIQALAATFSASKVVLHEEGDAKISYAIGKELTANEKVLADALDLTIRAGGVGVIKHSYFRDGEYFGFLGQTGAKPFEQGILAYGY